MAQNKGKRAGIRERAAVKRKQAFELRLKGHSYGEICEAVGCSRSRAHSLVTEYLDKMDRETSENAHRVLQMEVARLDNLLTKAQRQLEDSWSDKTAEIILKIQARRSAFLGLDKIQEKRILFSTEKISDIELKNRAKSILANETNDLPVRTDIPNQPTEH